MTSNQIKPTFAGHRTSSRHCTQSRPPNSSKNQDGILHRDSCLSGRSCGAPECQSFPSRLPDGVAHCLRAAPARRRHFFCCTIQWPTNATNDKRGPAYQAKNLGTEYSSTSRGPRPSCLVVATLATEKSPSYAPRTLRSRYSPKNDVDSRRNPCSLFR